MGRGGGRVFENEVKRKKNIISENGSSEAHCGLMGYSMIGGYDDFDEIYCLLLQVRIRLKITAAYSF